MKKVYNIFFLVSFVVISSKNFAQTSDPTRALRIYEDNDFFNISGHGTDILTQTG